MGAHEAEKGGNDMTANAFKGKGALLALLTLCGQNTYDHDALTKLLIRKGVITAEELDSAIQEVYAKGIAPAEWARRCINPEDSEALNAFFE